MAKCERKPNAKSPVTFPILITDADRRASNNRRGWFIQGLHKEGKNRGL